MSSSEETGTKLYRGELMKSKTIEGKLSLTNGKEEKSIPAEGSCGNPCQRRTQTRKGTGQRSIVKEKMCEI